MAYDFNSAFEAWGDVTAYDPFIFGLLPKIMQANKCLIPKLGSIACVVDADKYLPKSSKMEIKMRAEYLLSLACLYLNP